jgi:hypothetical protein
MDLRVYAAAEVRKGGSMSKAPDLSVFPIPRKGGAKPMVGDDMDAIKDRGGEGEAPEASSSAAPAPAAVSKPDEVAAVSQTPESVRTPSVAERAVRPRQQPFAPRSPAPPPLSYGQIVATTVKLDENRYLRLMEAGKPGPGRLKRRTIQDMLIEALDEWFERRRI